MGLTADAVIEAFWAAADDLPGDPPLPVVLHLLAGLCERLDAAESSARFRETVAEARAGIAEQAALFTGTGVRLGYCYSRAADGDVELTTYNSDGHPPGETGTVVGTPGVRVRFDAAEAWRAVTILGALFGFRSGKP